MKFSQAERMMMGRGRNDNNHTAMTTTEYKSIRKALNLSQEGMAVVLGVDRRWIATCEKDSSKISYAHSFILRLLMDMPTEGRSKWITVPSKGKNGNWKRLTKTQRDARTEDTLFKKEGYVV